MAAVLAQVAHGTEAAAWVLGSQAAQLEIARFIASKPKEDQPLERFKAAANEYVAHVGRLDLILRTSVSQPRYAGWILIYPVQRPLRCRRPAGLFRVCRSRSLADDRLPISAPLLAPARAAVWRRFVFRSRHFLLRKSVAASTIRTACRPRYGLTLPGAAGGGVANSGGTVRTDSILS